jgi:two-component system, chemotaxis family, protein-glutamate methylesterase/glutaminase
MKELINATCPECRGPLSAIADDGLLEFECLVGHRYSPRSLLHEHYATQERELWSAVVALEETPKLVNALRPYTKGDVLENLQREAERKVGQAKLIRAVLEDLRPLENG